MLELLAESKQEIPPWLIAIGESARSGPGMNSRRSGQKKYGGGGNFSSRDYRQQGGQGGRGGGRGGSQMIQSGYSGNGGGGGGGGGYGNICNSMYSNMGSNMSSGNDGGAYQNSEWW